MIFVVAYGVVAIISSGVFTGLFHAWAEKEFPASTPKHVEAMDFFPGVIAGVLWPVGWTLLGVGFLSRGIASRVLRLVRGDS